MPVYSCHTETEKPEILLVHEPGLETRLAVEDPIFWGFDPSLKEYPRPFEKWLEDAKKEHQAMVSILQNDGIGVSHVTSLLEHKREEIVRYLNEEFSRIQLRIRDLGVGLQNIIQEAYEAMLTSPVTGLLLGLEYGKKFQQLPYDQKLEVYKKICTFMPQTSLYYTQDPVISSPSGLIKAKMSMFIRRQEPHILEIALGKENYVHRLRNGTEGGDVTMSSYAHGGDVLYAAGRMLFGVSALSGRGIEAEFESLIEKAGVDGLVKLYTPDFFNPSQRYATENVMHLDTLMMPIDHNELLANIRMLEETAVREGTNPLTNAHEWAKRNFDRIVEVPDDEQQGTYGWGSNILPLGDRKILSSTHLKQTNKNLRDAGYEVIDIISTTLTSGFGSHHCMIAYLK